MTGLHDMDDNSTLTLPKRTFADRLTRGLAIVTVLATAVLLVIGGMVTSFRAGMTDPIWPTEPWYLATTEDVWKEERAGFLIEHSHRAMGFLVGAVASLLALAAWFTERKKLLRWLGLVATFSLLVVYGQFHRDMGQAWHARQAGEGLTWPKSSAVACAVAAVVLIGVGAASVRAGGRGGWLRMIVTIGLVAVMVQGLLGGFRVFLDQLLGTELAAIHGTFAQLVFCALVAAMILAAPHDPSRELTPAERSRVGTLSLVVPASIVVQLVWGVLVRHTGSPLSQRLHILTAFLVTGLTVWLAARCLATPAGRQRLGFYAWHLLMVLAVQLLLGVEAYMGKFAAAGPYMDKAPGLRPVTISAAAIRTAHLLIGTGLLATAVALALRVWRRAGPRPVKPTPEPAQYHRETAAVS